jgi:hypothetical protein
MSFAASEGAIHFFYANVIVGNPNSLSVTLRKQPQIFAAHFDFGPDAGF